MAAVSPLIKPHHCTIAMSDCQPSLVSETGHVGGGGGGGGCCVPDDKSPDTGIGSV